MMFLIIVIAECHAILFANSAIYMNRIDSQLNNSKYPLESVNRVENHHNIFKFVSACITLWNLKSPKIFLNDGIIAMQLYLKLSEKYHQSVVRVGFDEQLFKEIVFRDSVAANTFIFGDKNVIINALKRAVHFKLRIYSSFIILVCFNCNKPLTLDDINADDFIGHIIVGIPENKDMRLSLYAVTYEYSNRSLSQKVIGYWDKVNGLHTYLLKDGQYSFKNATLNVLYAPVNSSEKTVAKFMPEDFVYSLFRLIANILNFRPVNYYSKEMTYGDIDERGRYNGVIGDFIDKKFDIGVGTFSATPIRRSVIDFTVTYFKDKVGIVYRKPSTLSRETRRLLMKSFNLHVWLTVIIFGLLLAIVIAITFRWSYLSNCEKLDLGSTLLSTWLQKGKCEVPSSMPAKILVFTSYAFWWIIFCFYNSVLITYLTLDTTTLITTVEEISTSDYRFGVFEDSSTAEILRTSKNTIVQSINKKIYKVDPGDYIDDICKVDNYAAVVSIAMDISFANLNCEVMRIKENLMFENLHFITQKHSVLDKRLSNVIMKLRETGIISRLERLYQITAQHENQRKGVDSFKSISLEHLFIPFVILLMGILLSIIVLIFEIAY